MEGLKKEDWWFGEYPKYSLKDYKDMLIYQRFSTCVKPFNKVLGEYREAFWRDENCYILEWFDSKEQKGEKFGLDYNSYTYFYEHWLNEEDVHVVEKSWLCNASEWGVVIKYYPEYEEEVAWTMENSQKVLETRTKTDQRVDRKAKGTKLTPDGIEDFSEVFWQTSDGFNREKYWTRGTAKGEEKEAKDGDKLCGESWTQDLNQSSQKKWFEEGNKKWGEGEGKEGYDNWKQKWEKDSEGSVEEIEYQDRFQRYGKLRVRSKSGNFKIDWEGKRPEVSIPENPDEEFSLFSDYTKNSSLNQEKGKRFRSSKPGEKNSEEENFPEKPSKMGGMKKPAGKKLRSSGPGRKHEDPTQPSDELTQPTPFQNLQSVFKPFSPIEEPAKVSETSKLGFQLANLYKDLKQDLVDKLNELKANDLGKDFTISLSNLSEDLKVLKDPGFDPQESLAAIQSLRDFDKLLTAAEKSLIASQPTPDQLTELFDKLSSSINTLAPTLDPSNLSSAATELEYLKKEFDSSFDPKDKLRKIAGLNPVIDDLLRASQKTVKDEDKEIAEISQKISPLLKGLEEALKESQQTLKNIREKFGDKDESVETILAAYAERSKEVLKDLDSSAPYTKTIPKINSLLVDMEKYKRQLLETDLERNLQDLQTQLSNLNKDLRTDLQGSAPESKAPGQTLSVIVPDLQSELNLARTLVDKALGKDVKTGNEELDSIKPRSLETFTIDPADLLKDLWVQGKSLQDTLTSALNSLLPTVGNDEDKQLASDLIEHGEKSVTGIAAESKPAALEQLSSNLSEFLPNLQKELALLSELSKKAQDLIKENEVKPETVKTLWKTLIVADKVCEKLIQTKVPESLDEVRKVVEAFPPVPKPVDMQREVLKYEEIILGLANINDELTAEELKKAENAAEKRMGGKGKSGVGKPKKAALRSGRGARFTFVEPTVELVEASLRTTSELVLWVLGSRPQIARHLENLILEKDELLKLIQEKYGSEECTDKLLSFLKKLEDAKQGTYTGSDTLPSLSLILQKSEKILETTSKIVNSAVPAELEELKKMPFTENLSEYNKKIGFVLNTFFKMVKDVTGVDEGGENFEDALEAMKKKQAVSLLPFDAEELLRFLNARSLKDVKRLKFLAGLIGTDEDVQFGNEIEQKAASVWPEISNISSQEALDRIEEWIHSYPEIENEIEAKNAELLAQLVEKLLNPEPLEKDVGNLIETSEKLKKALEKLLETSKVPLDLQALENRKEELPSNSKDLLPYMTELVKDFATATLDQVSGPEGITEEAKHKLAGDVHKKLKTCPVQVVREIQHLFSGPDAEDMVSVIIKVKAVLGHYLKTHKIQNEELLHKSEENYNKLAVLNPVEIKELGLNYCELLLSLIPGDDLHSEEHELTEMRNKRKGKKTVSTATWAEIFKSKGLDIDANLITEVINEEQQIALNYILSFPGLIGTQEQKKVSQSLSEKSKNILQDIDEKSKIENYFQLRLEESKLVSGLLPKLQAIYDRISELDRERENSLTRGFAEVSILVEQNNIELKEQLQMLVKKEDEYKAKENLNTVEGLIRLANRLALEKELARLKEEAKPKNNENEGIIKALSALEIKLYGELKGLCSLSSEFSAELNPSVPNFKHLTEPEISTTLAALLASFETGLNSHNSIVQALVQALKESPVKNTLATVSKLILTEMQKDDNETEFVFSGLFRLCGSGEDKAKSKKLHENRVFSIDDKHLISEQAQVISESLEKLLPARSEQSKLQSKLIKDAGRMREGVDDIDVSCEELLSKAAREAANSILPEDSRSKEALEKLRKVLEGINEKPATNIPDCVDRISQRLDQWDKLERLRRDLREKSSKEINRFKGEIQDKLNELSTAKANLEGQKTHYDAQIALLQNTADLNASLVEKLTNEAIEKEKNLSAAKNLATDLKSKNEELEEDLQKLQEEIDSINKEIRNLRRVNKEKDGQIRELESNLESFERSTEKSSLGEKEKSEVLDKLRAETRVLREEVEDKVKKIDDLSDLLGEKERVIKKLDIEKTGVEGELEKLRTERGQLKAELMKTVTEKNEIEEKMRMTEGTEEVRQLERILEDKQRELEEAEQKLHVAKRYQSLYPELVQEKQEVENKLREIMIDYEEYKRKADTFKAENDQLRFKVGNSDGLSKDLAEAQKESQKLRIRLNFVEQSGNQDVKELAQKLSEDISAKEKEIQAVLDELEELKKKLRDQVDKYNKTLARSFLVRLCHVFKEQEGEGFRKWRVYRPEKENLIDFVPSNLVLSFPETEDELNNPDSYKAADKALRGTNEYLISTSKIVEVYKTLDHSIEKPMSFINVFKFLEELMDKKQEADRQASSEKKSIQSMPGFMLDYLSKTFGIQSLSSRFLNQFLLGFHDIYKENQKYAVLFARILQIFHPDPSPLVSTTYLLKARSDFNPLIEKYERQHGDADKTAQKKKELTGRTAYESAGTGGVSFLGDTIELIYSLFANDKESGERALELIKPEKVTIEDYVAFKICHKMAKLGKTPEMIFTLLDKDQGGTIDVSEFISGTKEDLDLWISDKNITLLLEQLDVNGNKEITKESFMGKINMKYLLECNKNPTWTVSKATFLTTLLDVFKFKERKLMARVHKGHPEDVFSFEAFKEVVAELEPNVNSENLEKMFDEAKWGDGSVSLGDVVRVAGKYGMSEVKSFKSRDLVQELTWRKNMVEVIENQFVSMFKNSESSSRVEGGVRIDREVEETVVVKKKVVKKVIKKVFG